jgi:hypothetical protein
MNPRRSHGLKGSPMPALMPRGQIVDLLRGGCGTVGEVAFAIDDCCCLTGSVTRRRESCRRVTSPAGRASGGYGDAVIGEADHHIQGNGT